MTEITQAREQQQVALKLRSLNIPEAELALLPIRTGSTPKTINLKRESLLLNPGAKSQMYVRLVNRGGAPLNLRWEVAGDFPLAWHQVDSSEAQLLPGEATEVILNFLVPDDFFEAEDALTSNTENSNTENWRNRSLQLDYYGKLHLYTSRDTEESVQTTGFNLFVRPNTRYLDFLPQIYREVDFIGRFLKIIETTFEPDLQILESFWAYLDPLTAPESMLPFLAHWVGWELEPNIPTRLQRRLIRYAMQIYRWRGTRHGLRFFLHLLTGLPLDEHISIRESFSRGFIFGETRLGEDAILGGGKPFHFSVHLRRDLPERQLNEEVIRLVIDREKPAFCTYDLEIED